MSFVTKDTVLGYLSSLVAVAGYCSSLAASQALQGTFPLFHLLLPRFSSQFLISVVVLGVMRIKPTFDRRKTPYMLLVTCFLTLTNACQLQAAPLLPVATGRGCFCAFQMFTCVMFSLCVQKAHKASICASMFLCVIGLICSVQPQWIGFKSEGTHNKTASIGNFSYHLSYLNNTETSASFVESQKHETLGYILAAAAGTSGALPIIIVNHRLAEVKGFVTIFYVGMIGTLISIAGLAAFETPRLLNGLEGWALAGTTSVGLGIAVISITFSSIYLPPSEVAIILNSTIVVMLILQKTVLHDYQPGHGNILEIIGIVLLIIGVIAGPCLSILTKNSKDEENEKLLHNDQQTKY